jgi:DNA-binding response OmpR family regulator
MMIKVVEDEVDIAVLYKLTLQSEGHDVELITSDFDQVFKSDSWSNTNIAILDLMIPECPGEIILNYLKKNCPWVKVIIVTAALNMVTDTILSEADMVLSKPFRPLDLMVAIESNLTESSKGATVLRRTMHKYIWEGVTVNGGKNRRGKL